MIHVRVLPFGVLKDWLGASPSTVELPEGATVAHLLDHLNGTPNARSLKGIAVSVNAEYASASHVLRHDDEVGLLPPVSGGIDETTSEASGPIALTREPIDAPSLIAASKQGDDGAVVVFDGIVRNHTRNRQTLHLDYEAYEEMALKQMRELALEARTRFNIRHVTMIHRLGRLQVGETSVLIVVASAHRAQAYEKLVNVFVNVTDRMGPLWAA
jgi:MoaE-MoaD fusion protein